MPSGNGEINERLQLLVKSRSQSELARLTGTSVANVNRYLGGRRVPAEFCSALVRKLGVNPAWLLTGDGSPFVADITAGTQKMAGDVLELVEAMNSVDQVRLGALTGKHHTRVLRELNDALKRHESLRQRLNRHSADIFRVVLKDLENALWKRNREVATDLLTAAEQVERLCDEPALSRQFMRLRGHYEFQFGSYDEALHYQRRLVRERVAEGRMVEQPDSEAFMRLALMYNESERCADAVRVCEALKAMAGDDMRDWRDYHDVSMVSAMMLLDTGRLLPGLTEMQRHINGCGPRHAPIARHYITRAQLQLGLLTFDDAINVGEAQDAKVVFLLEAACWNEDAEQIRRTFEYAKTSALSERRGTPIIEFALHMQMSLAGKPGLASYLKGNWKGERQQPWRPHPVHACALALMEGNRKGALEHHKTAAKDYADDRTEAQVPYLIRAHHHRNALRLEVTGKAKTRADQFFQQAADQGAVFRP